jgi:hypothetical protein
VQTIVSESKISTGFSSRLRRRIHDLYKGIYPVQHSKGGDEEPMQRSRHVEPGMVREIVTKSATGERLWGISLA